MLSSGHFGLQHQESASLLDLVPPPSTMSSPKKVSDDNGIALIVDMFDSQLRIDNQDGEMYTKQSFSTLLLNILNIPTPYLDGCSPLAWLGVLPAHRVGSVPFGPTPPPDSNITALSEQLQNLMNIVCQMKYESEQMAIGTLATVESFQAETAMSFKTLHESLNNVCDMASHPPPPPISAPSAPPPVVPLACYD